MWHLLHLIARPIEVLLGLFCVLTAILLYPTEDGKIQSRLEGFWVRVDDYEHLNCVFAMHVHLVFVTKYRRCLLDGVEQQATPM